MVPPYAAVMAAPFFVLWVVWVRRLCAREQSSRARDEESHTIQHIYVVGIHRRDPGKQTALFAPFIYKMHYFTKTGSGRS
jgi:hypothetical protein